MSDDFRDRMAALAGGARRTTEEKDRVEQAKEDYLRDSFVAEANGHTIRRHTTLSRGDLFCVGGVAYPTVERALAWCEKNPKR